MKLYTFVLFSICLFLHLSVSSCHSSQRQKEAFVNETDTKNIYDFTTLVSSRKEDSNLLSNEVEATHHSIESCDAMSESSFKSCINEADFEQNIDTRNWKVIRSFLSMLSWPHLQSLHHLIQDVVQHPDISLSLECRQSLLHFVNGINNHESWAFKGELFVFSASIGNLILLSDRLEVFSCTKKETNPDPFCSKWQVDWRH